MYNAGKAAGAFQIPAGAMIKAFCKPRIKVGTEWVTKGENENVIETPDFIFFKLRSDLRAGYRRYL